MVGEGRLGYGGHPPAHRRGSTHISRHAALGFEGASPGVAVVGRRGIGSWRMRVTGRQAHSSVIFRNDQGFGAIFEAARILDQFREQLREPNLTYNPSVILGGTTVSYGDPKKGGTAVGKTNVIAREVRVAGDVRFLTAEQYAAATERMAAIVAGHLPQASATIEFDLEYPSMAPTGGNHGVLDVLDGIGALGDEAHAPAEYLEVDAMAVQVRRAALLFHRLTR